MITVKTVPCVLLGRVNSKIIIVGYLCQTYITRVDLEWVGGGGSPDSPPLEFPKFLHFIIKPGKFQSLLGHRQTFNLLDPS